MFRIWNWGTPHANRMLPIYIVWCVVCESTLVAMCVCVVCESTLCAIHKQDSRTEHTKCGVRTSEWHSRYLSRTKAYFINHLLCVVDAAANISMHNANTTNLKKKKNEQQQPTFIKFVCQQDICTIKRERTVFVANSASIFDIICKKPRSNQIAYRPTAMQARVLRCGGQRPHGFS